MYMAGDIITEPSMEGNVWVTNGSRRILAPENNIPKGFYKVNVTLGELASTQKSVKVTEVKPNLVGLDTNLTNANKWFAYLPIENVLGKKYNNLTLHLTRFSLPQMMMGTTTVSFKGYLKEIPTKVMNAETKELTFEYLVDEKWQNYKALFTLMSGTEGNINKVVDEGIQPVSPSDYIPIRIYLLDNYKKKVIQFLFDNAWIKVFNDIALETQNSDEVTASVTFVYDRFSIEPID